MSTTNEVVYPGEFIISQQDGDLSRDLVTIAASQTLVSGSVLGQKVVGTAVASAVTGTGNGAITGVATTNYAQVGIYTFKCEQAVASGYLFSVTDPNGLRLSDLHVGSAYSNQIALSVAAGGTAFVVGDNFTVTVSAGTGQYIPVTPANTDGSGIAVAIARDALASVAATTQMTAITRLAEVALDGLDFNTLTAPQIAAAKAQLAQKMIIVRSTIGAAY